MCVWGGGCRAGQDWIEQSKEQGEVLAGEWEQLLLCDTLYQPKTHWFKFSSRYSIGLLTPSIATQLWHGG